MKKIKYLILGLIIILGINVQASEIKTLGDWDYKFYTDDMIEIYAYNGNKEVVDIPSEIEGVPVVKIDGQAFNYLDNLKEVNFPSSIRYIGLMAFSNCPNLKTINLNEGLKIIESQFLYNTGVEYINIPASVEKINSNPLSKNSNGKGFTISPGNKNFTLVDGVLYTKDLKTLVGYPPQKSDENYTVLEGTTSIGNEAFSYNSKLKTLIIPKSVTQMGLYSVLSNPNLEKVTINGNFETFEAVFYNDTYLKEIEFNGSVKSFAQFSFWKLPNIQKIILPKSGIEELQKGWLTECNPNVQYTVPSNLTPRRDGSYALIYKVHLDLDEYNYDFAKEVLRLINIERANKNLAPLTIDYDLTESAMLRSAEISAYFEHTRPDGTSALDIDKVWGENIHAGSNTPEQAVQAWMNSAPHKANILNADFKSIGIGCVKAGNIYYWTQLFSIEESDKSEVKKGTVSLNGVQIDILKDMLDVKVRFEGSDSVIKVGLGKTFEPYRVDIENFGWERHTVSIFKTDLKYRTSSNNIVTVSNVGTLTGQKLGDAKLYASLGDLEYEYDVKVIESFTIPEKVVLKVGEKYQIPVTYNPPSAKDKYSMYFGAPLYDSFYVNSDTGYVMALRPGSGTIHVQLSNGYKEDCEIIVVADYLKGDLDFNSKVEVLDAVEALYYYTEVKNVNDKIISVGDFNNNQKIDVTDAIEILMLYVNSNE